MNSHPRTVFIFHSLLHVINSSSSLNWIETVNRFLWSILEFRDLLKKSEDKFFGMKVKLAFRQNYLIARRIDKFISLHERLYLEKWFPFDKSLYCHVTSFGLGPANKSPSLNEVLEIIMDDGALMNWTFSRWFAWWAWSLGYGIPLPSWNINRKVVFVFQQGVYSNFVETYAFYYIPVSNACMERIFSVMGNDTDERNRVSIESVRRELCAFLGYLILAQNLRKHINNKKLLRVQ